MKDLQTQMRRCKTGIEVQIVTVEAKKLTSEERNNLPDSDFAYPIWANLIYLQKPRSRL